jgi:hypothetical protein
MKKKKAKNNKGIILDKKELRKYMPSLNQMNEPTQEWEGNAPRLTEEQKKDVQSITRLTYQKHMKKAPTRKTFNQIHEKMEEELYDKIREKLGLKATLEWRVKFGESATEFFAKHGMPHPGYCDAVLPTEDFTERGVLFDYVEEFTPVVTLHQFDEYDKFMSSAEKSISDAEKRRDRGEAYYTDLDKQINFRADVGVGDSLEED